MRLVIASLLLFSFPFSVPATFQQTGHSRGQTSQVAADRGWPRGYSLPSEAQIVMYQPQVASWEGQKHLVALSAVSFIAKDQQKPALGTVKIEADTSVSLERSLVKFTSLRFTE